MRFALGLANAADSWRTAVRAEELGFDTVWFEDSQMVAADPFVVMAAAAMKTTRIRLGTGVCIPTNRIPPVTANLLATLNALAPGRIDFGVGTGFSARRAMGLPAMSVATLGRHLRAVRGLLDGDTVEWSFEGQRRKLRFVNADLGLFNVEDPIEFHVAAMGPRTRALTADTASHWIAVYMHPAQAAAEIAEMNQAYVDAGEDPARFRKTAYTFGAVLRDHDSFDAPRIRQQAGPVAAMVLHNLMETQYGDLGTGGIADEALVEAYRHIYEAYEPADARYLSLHRGHALFLKPEEEAFVTGDFIRQCSFSDTAETLADRVKGMRDVGYTDVSFVVLPQYPEMVDDWARVRDLAVAG